MVRTPLGMKDGSLLATGDIEGSFVGTDATPAGDCVTTVGIAVLDRIFVGEVVGCGVGPGIGLLLGASVNLAAGSGWAAGDG